jgi:lysophospholipase L1-like esterase
LNAQGQQNGSLFVDGLHPSEAGYRVWRDRLLPALAAARAQRAGGGPS